MESTPSYLLPYWLLALPKIGCSYANLFILKYVLDTNIYVDKLGFCTSVHIKPTNQQQYLHFSGCHLSSTKSSTFSQAIHDRQICLSASDLSNCISNLTSEFASYGYPFPLLQCQIHYPYCTHYLITTYHPGLQSLRHFSSHHIILSTPSLAI